MNERGLGAGCPARRSTGEGRWGEVTPADLNGQAGSDTDSFQSVAEEVAEERATPPSTPPPVSPSNCSGGTPVAPLLMHWPPLEGRRDTLGSSQRTENGSN